MRNASFSLPRRTGSLLSAAIGFPPADRQACGVVRPWCAAPVRGKSMSESPEEHWLTYAELGRLLGCTANAARVRAQRHGWSRHAPNIVGGRAMVLVPEAIVEQARATHIAGVCDVQPAEDVRGVNGAVHPHLQALVRAIDSLTGQLAIANARADRAEARAAVAERERHELQQRLIRMLMRRQTGSVPSVRPPARIGWWQRWLR